MKSLKHTGKREREKKGKKKKVNAIKMSRPICQREKQHGKKRGEEEEYSKSYCERIHFNVYWANSLSPFISLISQLMDGVLFRTQLSKSSLWYPVKWNKKLHSSKSHLSLSFLKISFIFCSFSVEYKRLDLQATRRERLKVGSQVFRGDITL